MQTKSFFPTRQMPSYPVRFTLGMLILLLTMLLLVTAVGSEDLWADEACQPAQNQADIRFSAETAVPNCWLVQ